MGHLILLSVLLALGFMIAAKWTDVITLKRSKSYDYGLRLLDSYRDPASKVNHVVFAYNGPGGYSLVYYYYFAIDDKGNVLHQTTFENYRNLKFAAIKGMGDGRNLCMVLDAYTFGLRHNVNYTESSDGGKTWSVPRKTLVEDFPKFGVGMIYVVETGRVFLFIRNNYNNDIMLSSKPPGSTVFTKETLVMNETKLLYETENLKVAYTMKENSPVLHMVYATKNYELVYIRSEDNGVTWTPPKVIVPRHETNSVGILSLASDPKTSNTLYVIYFTTNSLCRLMLWTEDHGTTFKGPVPASGLALGTKGAAGLCGTKERSILAGYFTSLISSPDYIILDTTEKEPIERNQPFDSDLIDEVSISCSFDPNSLEFTTAIFGHQGSAFSGDPEYIFFLSETAKVSN